MGILQGKGIWTLYDDITTATNIAPTVGAKFILCKVSNMGVYDTTSARQALRLVKANPDLTPVAWIYPYLKNLPMEAACIEQALREGFAAVIIDAEREIFGKFSQAEQLVQLVQATGLDQERLYLCSDYRLNTKMGEIPYTAYAKICRGGFMPMIYGEFVADASQRSAAAKALIADAYAQYETHKSEMGYTIPMMPVISSCWDREGKARMTDNELKRWCDEVEAYSPTFVSLWRGSLVRTEAWASFQKLKVNASETVEVDVDDEPAKAVLVQPGGVGYTVAGYNGQDPNMGWQQFTDQSSYVTRYRPTVSRQRIAATYKPDFKKAGRYLVEVYIPNAHATTNSAQYFLVFYEDGNRQEDRIQISQRDYSDVWTPLAIKRFDPKQQDAGRVNLVDQTALDGGKEGREIAFSAIRWVPVVEGGPGFDPPIGTESERSGLKVWPGFWVDATPYLTKYFAGYHTGADLNLNNPSYDADRGKPIYAAADGKVVFAEVVQNSSWNGLIVVEHTPLPDGKPVYSRYGHVENILVKVGDSVSRGQRIAQVGLFKDLKYPAGSNYHLHFDISCTTILKGNPRHWPQNDLNSVKVNYVDPKKFIEQHRPPR